MVDIKDSWLLVSPTCADTQVRLYSKGDRNYSYSSQEGLDGDGFEGQPFCMLTCHIPCLMLNLKHFAKLFERTDAMKCHSAAFLEFSPRCNASICETLVTNMQNEKLPKMFKYRILAKILMKFSLSEAA